MRRNLLRSMLLVVSLLMGINGAFAAEGDELPVAENIAALKAMENDTEVKLMLNNVQVTLQVMGHMGSQTIIEDATGGLQIINGDEMGDSGLEEIFNEVGQTFNGYIYCRYKSEYGATGIQAIDATATDTYTVTTEKVIPRDATMAEVCSADGAMRYVRLSDVTLNFDPTTEEYPFPFILHQGNNTMCFYDMMQAFISADPETGEYIFPENIKDLCGYAMDMGGVYGFIPMSLIPSIENIAAAKNLENDTEIALNLNNAQVTLQVMGHMGSQTILEDETGGLQIIGGNWNEESIFDQIFTTVGQTFNGYVYCRYKNEYGTVGIEAIDKTTTDTYTVTIEEVTPRDATVAEVCNADGAMRYVRLSDVTVTCDLESSANGDILFPFVLHQGNNTMYFYDMMQAFISYDEEKEAYVFPESIKDLNGYAVDMGGEYGFVPMSLIPSIENIAAAKNVEDGTEIALALNGTKVTQCGWAMYNYIEDESGALKTDYSFGSLDGFYEGQALTGYIYGTIYKDENGLCSINMSENTGRSQIKGEETTITPTATTLADIVADPAAIAYKYINLKNVTVTSEGEGWEAVYYITDGKNTIELDNWTFYTLPEDFMPEMNKLITVNGFVDADWYGDFLFMPYGEDYEIEYKPATEVNSIAELKALKSGTSAQLNMNDVKVTAVEQIGTGAYAETEVYIEDESGAIMIGSDLPMGLDDYYFAAAGNTLNGILYGTYYNENSMVSLNPSPLTTESKITFEEGTVTPKEISIDGIDIEADEYRLVKLSNATMVYDEEIGFILIQGENSIIVRDRYYKATELTAKLLGYTEDEIAIGSLTIASATGILMQQAIDWDEDTWEPTAYATYLVPVGEGLIEGTGTGINAVNNASLNGGDVYTVDGVKVRKAGESLNGLAKGLYIVNGKKVVIK